MHADENVFTSGCVDVMDMRLYHLRKDVEPKSHQSCIIDGSVSDAGYRDEHQVRGLHERA